MPDIMTLPNARAARLVKTSIAARELVGRSVAIARVQELVRRAALANGGVLLVADRGVDVESVARELHERTRRPAGPFEPVECAAADSGRLDRLLFGPPPAVAPSDLECAAPDSRIAAACGGTLFLKDMTDMPASVQARIARVARDGEVRIDGAATATNMRWIGSAAPGIEADVHANRFRSDLFRRLSASRIDLPSLRDRAEDVPALAARLLEDWCAAQACAPRSFTQPALALLSALTWPGNVAELHVVVERAATNTPHEAIQIEDVLPALNLDRIDRTPARVVPVGNLRDARLRFERDYISSVLQHHSWRMAEAAHALGIQRPNLYRKARQLGRPSKPCLTSDERNSCMNLVVSILFATLLTPQAPPPAATSPSRPEPASVAAPAKYMIGAQDLLKITVFDEPDLTNSYRVDGDGFITFPYISRVAASGLTLGELQDRIRTLLSAGFIRNPQVRVEIGEFKSQSVLVSGEVRQPGKITMTGSMTLLEALAAAGSATSSASSELTVAHPKHGTEDSEVARINWKDLQLGKGTDVGLQDGDIINVPKAQTFFITGQIRNGGSYVLEPGTTMQQAIAMAGGLSERGSDRGITVTRLVNGRSTDVKVSLEDKVQPNDTILIRNRFF